MFFFFFQAEDGIRDKLVTGVQTCALPIAVVFNVAEDSPQNAPRLLVGNETSVLVDQALWRQLSRATHLSECVDVEGLSLSKDRIGDQTVQAEPETAID